MNIYVDENYYKNDFEGTPVDSKDFSRYSKRASAVIDSLTDYQIQKIGIDKFTDEVQTMIKNACCSQIEYYQLEGIDLDASGSILSGQSASIGGFSYSSSNQSTSKQANRVAPGCLSYLEGTGLLKKRRVRIGVI